MKALLVILGVFTFVTQAHCYSTYSVDDASADDFLSKNVPLKITNESTKEIFIEFPKSTLETNLLLGTTNKTNKIQVKPGKTIEIDPVAFGLGNGKITGFTFAIDDFQKRYVKSNFKAPLRFTDSLVDKLLITR